MRTAKEIFTEVWKEWFGDEDNDQLNIALEHDYIFESMERYKQVSVKPVVKPEIAEDYLEQAIHYVELLGVRGYSAIDSSRAEMKVRDKILKFRDYLKTLSDSNFRFNYQLTRKGETLEFAMQEYKSDIIKMIDGMIDDKNGYWIASEQDYYDTTVLHELKQKIEKS